MNNSEVSSLGAYPIWEFKVKVNQHIPFYTTAASLTYFVFCGASRALPLCFSALGDGRVLMAALGTTSTFGRVLAAGMRFPPRPLLRRFGWLLGG